MKNKYKHKIELLLNDIINLKLSDEQSYDFLKGMIVFNNKIKINDNKIYLIKHKIKYLPHNFQKINLLCSNILLFSDFYKFMIDFINLFLDETMKLQYFTNYDIDYYLYIKEIFTFYVKFIDNNLPTKIINQIDKLFYNYFYEELQFMTDFQLDYQMKQDLCIDKIELFNDNINYFLTS